MKKLSRQSAKDDENPLSERERTGLRVSKALSKNNFTVWRRMFG